MELILKRIAKKKEYTIGRLYILGDEDMEVGVNNRGKSVRTLKNPDQLNRQTYFCDTLEPFWRYCAWGCGDAAAAGETGGRG